MPKDLSVHTVRKGTVKIKCPASDGKFLQVDDDDDVMVDGLTDTGNEKFFKQMVVMSYSGGIETLTAFERKHKKNSYMYPAKPKADQVELKLKFKNVKSSKVLDHVDMEIEGKYRKFWFRTKTTADFNLAYESLAYKNYFLFWNGKKVVMRKSSDDEVSRVRGFSFDVMMSKSSIKRHSVKVRMSEFEDTVMTTNDRQTSDGKTFPMTNTTGDEDIFTAIETVQEETFTTTDTTPAESLEENGTGHEKRLVGKWFSKLSSCFSANTLSP